MSSSEGSRNVSRPKQARIVHSLLGDIVSGRLRPGSALPGQIALSRRFGVSPVTVKLALRELASHGHLRIRGRVGTFVSERQPHLDNYALVFPADPVSPSEWEYRRWSRYYMAITAAAVELQREMGPRLAIFHGIDFHVDSEDRQRLEDHIHSRRLAGIIFANSPHYLKGTPILDEPDIPRVALAGAQQWPHVPAITFDGEQWLAQALGRLEQRGRRRVAVLFNTFDKQLLNQVNRAFAAHGLVCPPYWQQAVRWNNREAVSHNVQLLMRGPAADRPDGLLVMDDNLVEGVTAGLVAAEVRVSADVDVVAHVNYPLATPPALPFHVLGYDLGAALRTGLDLIDRQRQDEAVAGLTILPAIWREDWQPAAPRLDAVAQQFSGQTAEMEMSSVPQ